MTQTHKIYDNCPTCKKNNYVDIDQFHPDLDDYDLTDPYMFLALTEEQLEALKRSLDTAEFYCSTCDANYNRYSAEYVEQRELINKILEI